jgi:hypothetical protein
MNAELFLGDLTVVAWTILIFSFNFYYHEIN